VTEVWLSPAARADLVAIREYSIDQFDADTADAYFLGFEAAFDLLREHPLAGPAKPELGKGIRCMVHRRHRIFYHVKSDLVLIVRIVHHAQDNRLAFRKAAK
jgi:toxin ParE1/3/4